MRIQMEGLFENMKDGVSKIVNAVRTYNKKFSMGISLIPRRFRIPFDDKAWAEDLWGLPLCRLLCDMARFFKRGREKTKDQEAVLKTLVDQEHVDFAALNRRLG
jgi:hypothetical protein